LDDVTKGVNVVKALRNHPVARLIALGAGTGLAVTTVRAYLKARRLWAAVRHDLDPQASLWLPPLPPAEPADQPAEPGHALSIPRQRSRSTAADERAQPVRARTR
jgi:antitoxin (DNA-binding transcriptional repressor) of toxin-antitoxin stability system